MLELNILNRKKINNVLDKNINFDLHAVLKTCLFLLII